VKDVKLGRLVTNGVILAPHEYETVVYFLKLGNDIELIPGSHTPKVPSPDFYMAKLIWESKSPTINKVKTIERLFYKAARQSSNVIFDLRRLNGDDIFAWRALESCFKTTRRVRRMYVILKNETLQNIRRNSCIRVKCDIMRARGRRGVVNTRSASIVVAS